MPERRPMSSFVPGDFDSPPATITIADSVQRRLEHLRRNLQRERQEDRRQADASRDDRQDTSPDTRRRRRLARPTEYTPTFERRSLVRMHERGYDDDEPPRYTKRRRLDSYDHPVFQRSYKYGHFGQVEPGRLKLELKSCDGGIHDDKGLVHYGPVNMLKHDQSVYSSKSKSCNIVLRHHDDTPFCLETVVIIAPRHGFTAPVKDGLISISMDGDELEKSTWGVMDRIRHYRSRPPRPTGSDAVPDEGQLEYEAFMRGDLAIHPTCPVPSAIQRTADTETQEEFVLGSSRKITLDHSGNIEWPEDASNASVLADRHRRERRARDLDDEECDEFLDDSSFGAYENGQTSFQTWAERQHAWLTNRYERSCLLSGGAAEDEDDPDSRDEITRVPFTFKKGKNIVAIKFSPPVSGTSLLIHVTSGSQASNVDVQSIIASGYAGPRYFPSISMK